MNAVSFLIFLLSSVYGHHEHHHIGFFWQDYSEDSHAHAVNGGKDSDGKGTYIGQVKHTVNDKEVVTPGIIYPDNKLMIYEWGKKTHEVNENFKILCTHYPDHMEWLSTNAEDIEKLSNQKELIQGGVDEHNHKIYIGKVQTNGEVLLGKVLVGDNNEVGFHASSSTGYMHKTSFKVLAHIIKH